MSVKKFKAVAILVAVAEEDVDKVVSELYEHCTNSDKIVYPFTHEVVDVADLDEEKQEELNSVLNQEAGE